MATPSLGLCSQCGRHRVPLFAYKPSDYYRFRKTQHCAFCARGMNSEALRSSLPAWAHVKHSFRFTPAPSLPPIPYEQTPQGRRDAANKQWKDRKKPRRRPPPAKKPQPKKKQSSSEEESSSSEEERSDSDSDEESAAEDDQMVKEGGVLLL